MVEKVEGFLAADNTFFPTAEECEAYESQEALKADLADLGIKAPEQAFALIHRCRVPILRYLNAIAAMPQEEMEDNGDESEQGDELVYEDDDNLSEGDDGEPEEDAQALQSLPPGVRKPMPDLGRHIQPTPIRHERPINGPRSRKPDARNLRGSKGVAAAPRRLTPKPRRGDG